MDNFVPVIQISAMGVLTFVPFAMWGWSLHPVLGAVGLFGSVICISLLVSFMLWENHVRS